MRTGRARADLIGDLYESATDAAAWSGLATPFAKAVDGVTAVVWSAQAGGEPGAAVTHGLPDDALALYLAYFSRIDPWIAAARRRGLGSFAVLGTDLVPEWQLVESEFGVDFALGFGIVETIAGHVALGPGLIAGVGVHRPRGARRFEPRDVSGVRALLPHLQRALQLRARLGTASGEIGLAALDALAFGAAVCDAAGRVMFANVAAEAAARAGAGLVLGDARSPIGAARPEEGGQLRALVRDAAAGGAGGGLALTGTDGAVLFVLVSPLPRRFGAGPPLALVTLRAAAATETVGAATLAALFRLTGAEAALAAALAAGRSLAAIGTERRVSENTLRTQLGHVLRKTGVRGQGDLMRLLGAIPPLRGSHEK